MHVLVTGGAGYIGSALVGTLLAAHHRVTVVDNLVFGGDAVLAYRHHPYFELIATAAIDVRDEVYEGVDGVVHLAALVGFPACAAAGREAVWQANVHTTTHVMEAATRAAVKRFVYASTYSNYGASRDGLPVTEESPLYPQSVYAESKAAAERCLLDRGTGGCAPVVLRFATLFGVSPRTRFDLIVNQFVLEAMTSRELVLYGANQKRAFIHIHDACRAIVMMLAAPREQVAGHVYNVGSEESNFTKAQVAKLVQKHVCGVNVTNVDTRFDGDMRDIPVSFEKIRRTLSFRPTVSVEAGIVEIRDAIGLRLIAEPQAAHRRNAALPEPSS